MAAAWLQQSRLRCERRTLTITTAPASRALKRRSRHCITTPFLSKTQDKAINRVTGHCDCQSNLLVKRVVTIDAKSKAPFFGDGKLYTLIVLEGGCLSHRKQCLSERPLRKSPTAYTVPGPARNAEGRTIDLRWCVYALATHSTINPVRPSVVMFRIVLSTIMNRQSRRKTDPGQSHRRLDELRPSTSTLSSNIYIYIYIYISYKNERKE